MSQGLGAMPNDEITDIHAIKAQHRTLGGQIYKAIREYQGRLTQINTNSSNVTYGGTDSSQIGRLADGCSSSSTDVEELCDALDIPSNSTKQELLNRLRLATDGPVLYFPPSEPTFRIQSTRFSVQPSLLLGHSILGYNVLKGEDSDKLQLFICSGLTIEVQTLAFCPHTIAMDPNLCYAIQASQNVRCIVEATFALRGGNPIRGGDRSPGPQWLVLGLRLASMKRCGYIFCRALHVYDSGPVGMVVLSAVSSGHSGSGLRLGEAVEGRQSQILPSASIPGLLLSEPLDTPDQLTGQWQQGKTSDPPKSGLMTPLSPIIANTSSGWQEDHLPGSSTTFLPDLGRFTLGGQVTGQRDSAGEEIGSEAIFDTYSGFSSTAGPATNIKLSPETKQCSYCRYIDAGEHFLSCPMRAS